MNGAGAGGTSEELSRLVPVEVGGRKIYLSVRQVGSGQTALDGEREIAAGSPRLEQVLDDVAAFAKEIVDRLQGAGASRVTAEFGCEVAVESGSFLAVIGKASASSTLTIGLEWVKPGS